MASSNPNKTALLSSFSLAHSFAPFYTGGPLAFSTDAHASIVYASFGDDLKIVRTQDAHTLHTLHADSQPITAIALSPDGSRLVVASRSLAIRIYDTSATQSTAGLSKPTLARTLARTHDAPITVLEVDPSSSFLASGSSDSSVKVWDLAGGFCTHIFPGHGGVVSALCWFMPGFPSSSRNQADEDGNPLPIHLFTAAVDGRIRVWDLRASAVGSGGKSGPKRKALAVLPAGAHDSVVRGLSISKDGLRLVSGARDRTVALWTQAKPSNPSTPHWTLKELLNANEGVESVGFLPTTSATVASSSTGHQQDVFYTAGSEGDLRIWSFTQAKMILRASDRDPTSAAALLAAGSKPQSTSLGDAEDYEQTTRAITQVSILPAAGALAVVHADQNIDLLSLGPHIGDATSVSGSILAGDRTLLKPIRNLVGYNDEVIDLALLSPEPASEDGKEKETHLAVCTNAPSLRVYSLPSSSTSSSSDSVSGLSSSASVSLLHGHTDIALCLDRSADGKWLASAGKDRTVRVWARIPVSSSPNRGAQSEAQIDQVWTCLAVAEGHTESVGALAFARKNVSGESGSGAAFLCSASQDRTTKLWDLAPVQRVLSAALARQGAIALPLLKELFPLKLKSLLTLKIHDKDINTLDVAPNNAFLASGSQDRTAKLFRLEYKPAQPSDIKHAATNAAASTSADASSASKKKGKHDADSGAAVLEASRILGAAASNVYATATLMPLTTCTGHRRGIWSVRFSPVDPAFVTASADRTIRMWSLLGAPQGSLSSSSTSTPAPAVGGDFGRCVKTFESHSNSVLRVLFFNRGMQLLSAGADGTCRVWNVRTEENIGVLDPRLKLEEILGEEKKEGSADEDEAMDARDEGGSEDEDDDDDEGAKVWALAVGRDLVSGRKGSGKGIGLISGGADSVIRFWEDQTAEIEKSKAKRRQAEVSREQEFSNFLTMRDYRNAIALALELDQPRRLLNLFTRIYASRPDPASCGLPSHASGPRSYLLAREGLLSDSHSTMASVLQSAGIIDATQPRPRAAVRRSNKDEDKDDEDVEKAEREAAANLEDAKSVTGLAAVDEVIRKLPSLQLIQLLLYVRDWNSTVRTSSIAQVVMHAILRFHPASKLMKAFDIAAPKLRARAATKGRAAGVRAVGDWGSVLDGLLPYTERHYARADRTLMESRTLEYTLAGMDAILGPAEWDMPVEEENGALPADVVNGGLVAGKGRALTNGIGNKRNAWADGDDESDGMDVDLDTASESDASEE
ncbi:U3 small nucleolar RNA-associated protein 13 [Tilletia horrida]|uniref:U3 small nucleolar RNA-associated protein 13 n=1 Tax=Tilletia horrida TaxID=155126 RepID=A0AAN6GPN3_9BASI|nr:U3 small nucleolar RNA-associated protein 13 [Tilletia horrida]KAK0551296.1 U3 small nucleolar RNA-associated protein 13 [Tilletia horrida]KAK0567619.1 U3 small nucleolar RNA-associated protein 13 [Tilletia horrida]